MFGGFFVIIIKWRIFEGQTLPELVHYSSVTLPHPPHPPTTSLPCRRLQGGSFSSVKAAGRRGPRARCFHGGSRWYKKKREKNVNTLTEYQSIALTVRSIRPAVPRCLFCLSLSLFRRRKMDTFLRRLFLNHWGMTRRTGGGRCFAKK